MTSAKFGIGERVIHRLFKFTGVVIDVDPQFNNDEEWWLGIPAEIRPKKEQPFYHLLALNEDETYKAYVSEQNLLVDNTLTPFDHPDLEDYFEVSNDGDLVLIDKSFN
ncbi:MAG: heat shock protein HspQ [Hyphomicrobiales bacterium]